MKKSILLLHGIMLMALFGGCFSESPRQPFYEKGLNAYIGENGKTLIINDMPENEEEALLADYFFCQQADYSEGFYEIFAESMRIEDFIKDDPTGAYREIIMINELTVYRGEGIDKIDKRVLAGLWGYEEDVEGLYDWAIVYTNCYKQWNTLEHGPQYGDGDFIQLFVVGKKSRNSSAKIYVAGMI